MVEGVGGTEGGGQMKLLSNSDFIFHKVLLERSYACSLMYLTAFVLQPSN